MILVVGATGQLGTAIIRRLVAANQSVRAFVRRSSRYQHLQSSGIELAFGDLRDPASVEAACQGVDVVIATANTTAPETPYSFQAIEDQGYQNLISTCQRQQIKQFIFVTVPITPHDDHVPTYRNKRLTEQRLKASGLTYTIFHASLFMDDWFALMGSRIPLRGAEAHTLKRHFWFLSLFMKAVGGLVEGRGIAIIPGSRKVRHAFVALDDVATFMVRAIGNPIAQNVTFMIGGPGILTWEEVLDLYGQILGRGVSGIFIPAGVFRVMKAIMSPFSEAASNVMGIIWLVSNDTLYDMDETTSKFEVSLTSVDQFLRQKASVPES